MKALFQSNSSKIQELTAELDASKQEINALNRIIRHLQKERDELKESLERESLENERYKCHIKTALEESQRNKERAESAEREANLAVRDSNKAHRRIYKAKQRGENASNAQRRIAAKKQGQHY